MSLQFLPHSEEFVVKYIFRNDKAWKNEMAINALINLQNRHYQYSVGITKGPKFYREVMSQQQVLVAVTRIKSSYNIHSNFRSHHSQIKNYVEWIYQKLKFDSYEFIWRKDKYDLESGAKLTN